VDRPDPNTVQKEDDETSSIDGLPELTEVLEVTNIYLVVFKEGICVFHFEDISRHIDAVRKKMLQLEGTIPMGSGEISKKILILLLKCL
jgi:magnesium transporter